MKPKTKIIFFLSSILLTVVLLSCVKKENKQQFQKHIISKFKADPNISIRFAGEVDFRRSYAAIQFMENENEINKYLDKQRKSNPLTDYEKNETLIKQLEKFGFVKYNELLLHKFKYNTGEAIQHIIGSKKKINILFKFSIETGDRSINVYSGNDSSEFKIDTHIQDLKYALLDIIPGGNKEIVLLNKYYISNGDNFELLVYEINTMN